MCGCLPRTTVPHRLLGTEYLQVSLYVCCVRKTPALLPPVRLLNRQPRPSRQLFAGRSVPTLIDGQHKMLRRVVGGQGSRSRI